VREWFSPDPSSVRRARALVAAELRDLPQAVRDEALLIISELATNAVVHARTEFVVEIDQVGDQVVLSVLDSAPTLPFLQDNLESVHGRGLRIIGILSENWGTTPSVAGKRIWAILRTSESRE